MIIWQKGQAYFKHRNKEYLGEVDDSKIISLKTDADHYIYHPFIEDYATEHLHQGLCDKTFTSRTMWQPLQQVKFWEQYILQREEA